MSARDNEASAGGTEPVAAAEVPADLRPAARGDWDFLRRGDLADALRAARGDRLLRRLRGLVVRVLVLARRDVLAPER